MTQETRLELGDEICIVGFLKEFVEKAGRVGPELSDPELLDVRIESCRVVILRRKIKMASTSLAKLTAERGCFVSRVQRMGMDIPLEGDFVVQAADVVHLTGPASRLDEVGKLVGHIERATNQTDLVTFALGITVGLLVGTWTVAVAGISVGLGSAGGLLVAGLVIGYLRALHPTFGRVPEPARWIFMELGLTIFMAGVGLRAGSGIIETLATIGSQPAPGGNRGDVGSGGDRLLRRPQSARNQPRSPARSDHGLDDQWGFPEHRHRRGAKLGPLTRVHGRIRLRKRVPHRRGKHHPAAVALQRN